MRQIVLEAPGRFAEREAPAPHATEGHALVQIQRVGVCGSDFHAFAGCHPIYTYPRIIGHELSGIVIEISPNDRGIKPGDRCAIEPYITCGKCRACVHGRNNCCESLQIFGIHVDGGMQEYLAVPIELLHRSEKLSLDELALIETLGIGAHAVERSGLKATDEAIIIGAGPIGIAVSQFASERGARVHIVEKNEWRRKFVEAMGYTATETAGDKQADVVFDATGSAEAMSDSLARVATGGTLVFVGLTSDPVDINDSLFHRREITLLASRNSFGLFPKIIQMIENNKIDTSPWITDYLQLSDVAASFESLFGRKTLIKAIVNINSQA